MRCFEKCLSDGAMPESRKGHCQNPSKAAISASAIGIRWMSDKIAGTKEGGSRVRIGLECQGASRSDIACD
jgi:hypothetical protein